VPLFKYRALQADGVIAEGRLQASGRQEAYRQLEGRGLKPVGLTEDSKEETTHAGTFRPEWRSNRVPLREVENFTRQLSSLLAAGVPLSRALKILSGEASTPVAREKWREVHDLVIDGMSLADAMARFPEVFPRVHVAMVQAGETGGFLDLVLTQIADLQVREKELRSKITSALVYPAVLLALTLGVVIYLLVFFIPRFESIFAGFGAALPGLTLFVVAISEAVTKYGVFVTGALLLAAFLVRQKLQTDQGRRKWQQLVLRLPLVGQLSARFAMTRFCRMLGTLLGAGVPLINGLRVARESIGNQTLTDAVNLSIERVKQGNRLAASLSDCHELFPASVLEMISVAEETGRLDKELVRLATVTDSDLDRQLRTAVSLAEPIMLFVMAAFIGTIFVGMVIPIFTLQGYIK
jgi:type II secretory pathway component PulF